VYRDVSLISEIRADIQMRTGHSFWEPPSAGAVPTEGYSVTLYIKATLTPMQTQITHEMESTCVAHNEVSRQDKKVQSPKGAPA